MSTARRFHVLARLCLAVAIATVIAACASTRAPAPAHGGFVARSVDVDGRTWRYQVFVPAGIAPAGGWPVVLFLHGSGERGTDNRAQLKAGVGPYLRAHAASFPALVVLPQSPEDQSWQDDVADMAFAALDATITEFGADRHRQSLTGMSRGGYGVFELALRQPTRFAALAPVCGGVVTPPTRPDLQVEDVHRLPDPYTSTARALKDTPIWLFHGAHDDIVPPSESRRLAAAFRAAGDRDVRHTEFPDANHNSWDPAYSETPDFWTWLLAQRR